MDVNGRAPLSEYCWDWLQKHRPLVYDELLLGNVQAADFIAADWRLRLDFRELFLDHLPPATAEQFDRQADASHAVVVLDCPSQYHELFLDIAPVRRSRSQEWLTGYEKWLSARNGVAATQPEAAQSGATGRAAGDDHGAATPVAP